MKLWLTLENTEEAIKNGQSRETGNIWYTRRRKTKLRHNTTCVGHTGTRFIYMCVYYLRLSIKKGPYRFRDSCLSSRSKKMFLDFLNDLRFILFLKYDNCSTTWCMTRLPLLPIIYVRAHYIIQLEIHKNTSYFSGNTDAAVNRMERSDWSIEISKNKLGIFGCIYNSNL